MTGLVQRAEEPGEHIVGIEARRDADIARNTLGERMLALVEPPAVERETDGLHPLDDQRTLLAGRKFPAERQRGVRLLHGDRLADQAREASRQGFENRV